MNKRTLIAVLTLILSIVTFVVGCSYSTKMTFEKNDAISFVLQAHKREVEELEFPTKVGETKTVEIYVGGKPSGQTIPVELTTNVDKISEETYNVTFTKVWKGANAASDVESFWTYKVAPKEVSLTKS